MEIQRGPELLARIRALDAGEPLLRAQTASPASTWSEGPHATCCSANGRSISTSSSRATRRPSPRGSASGSWRTTASGRRRRRSAAPSTTWPGPAASANSRPGALPDVYPAGIDDDLGRRDFTVNAIAVALGGEQPGSADRRSGRARRPRRSAAPDTPRPELPRRPDAAAAARPVSHRLGFEVEPATAALAESAVASGALATSAGRASAPSSAAGARAGPGQSARGAPQLGIDRRSSPASGSPTSGSPSWRSSCSEPAGATASRSPRRRARCGLPSSPGCSTRWRSRPPIATRSWPRRRAQARSPRRSSAPPVRRQSSRGRRGRAGGGRARGRAGPRGPGSGVARAAPRGAPRDRRRGPARGRNRRGPCRRPRAERGARREARRDRLGPRRRAGRRDPGSPPDGIACRHGKRQRTAMGRPSGHYEVYYLTVTDPRTGVGLWIRYTMVAPDPQTGEPPTCSLWFLAMDPRPGAQAPTVARKATYGIDRLRSEREPFELTIADATLTDRGMAGAFEDVAWELRWTPAARAYEPIHPLLQRLKLAKTVLVIPHAHAPIEGIVTLPGGESLELSGSAAGRPTCGAPSTRARGPGSTATTSRAPTENRPTRSSTRSRRPCRGSDGSSARTPRSSARIDGAEFRSTSPLRILRNGSSYGLDGWKFEATDGALRVVGGVEPVRDQLAGVTYHDPDGQLAYCSTPRPRRCGSRFRSARPEGVAGRRCARSSRVGARISRSGSASRRPGSSC